MIGNGVILRIYGGVVVKKLLEKHLLSVRINVKRTEMVKKAKSFGFTHPTVVSCSQELDLLLNRYQDIA